jgi:hypothetical protein
MHGTIQYISLLNNDILKLKESTRGRIYVDTQRYGEEILKGGTHCMRTEATIRLCIMHLAGLGVFEAKLQELDSDSGSDLENFPRVPSSILSMSIVSIIHDLR